MRSVLLIGGATLLALLLLLTLLTLSRRHYLDRIALEAEAKRQLEERVLNAPASWRTPTRSCSRKSTNASRPSAS